MWGDMTAAYLVYEAYSFAPQPCGVQFLQADSIYTNLSIINVIKSFQQSSHSRFTYDITRCIKHVHESVTGKITHEATE